MSHYKRYPAYKDSGVEWLGDVPETWDIKKISAVAALRNGYPFDSKRFQANGQEGHRLLRIRDLAPVDSYLFTDEDCPTTAIVSNGDILVGMDGEFNIVRWNGGEAKLNQRVCALNAKSELEEKFVLYTLPSPLKIINDLAYSTTVKHLSSTEVLQTRIAIPANKHELAQIISCLDRETTRIDALITKKTRFIELLREKRQALITHAVTKGLDPNVKMKDSGVEWLGEVPEHWTVASIKNWFKTSSGGTPDTSKQAEFYTQSGGYPWVRTTDLNNGELWDTEVRITEAALAASACSLLPENTVAVAMYGGEGTIGKFSIFRFPTTINQALCALLPNKHFVPEFVYWYIQHYRPYWMIGAESTRKDPNISQELIRAAPIVRPSLDEQLKISEQLSTVVGRIDALMEKTERSIELIKERRSALITSAVTGQIDLREAA